MKFISKIITLTSILLSSLMAAEKPNILFIAVDDLKPDLGCYGAEVVKTPNLDKLAKRGTLFLNAYANQAVCGPSRCSTFSSLRPDRTKVHDLKTDFLGVSPWVVTLPEHLKKHGYTTAGLGKLFHGGKSDGALEKRAWDLHTATDDLPYAEGFEPPVHHYQSKEARAAVSKLNEKKRKKYRQVVNALKEAKANPSTECLDIPDDAYADGAMRKEALNFMDKMSKGDKPFFLAVGFKKPHLAFAAPKKYWDLYERDKLSLAAFQKPAKGAPKYALHSWGELKSYSDIDKNAKSLTEAKQRELIHGYYACTSYIDAQIGLLLDGLKQRGLDKNTIVVLWGDHGWHLGDHGVWCKHSNYEQATRTVLMFAGPGVKGGISTKSPTELIDIFPTLCDLTQTEMIPNTDGVSLKPLLEGGKKDLREFAVSTYPRWKGMGYSLRDRRYRYTAWVDNHEIMTPFNDLKAVLDEELYDYETDPLETTNLAKSADHTELVKAFRAKLDKHLKQQAERIAKQKSTN